jgi:YidC/Oxa1 family membrane protein insertase
VSILNPLYDAIAWIIMRIQAVLAVPFGPSSGVTWALSIVLLVVLLRLVMLPLFVKQVRSQQRMQQHMPQLQELRKKYKNDKQKLNEETMKYYKENGVNPLSGCLPLLAQFPVFISLFSVLRAIADWKQHTPTSYGLTVPFVTNALKAHVFGVRLSDTFLHSTTPWSVRGVILVSVLISAATTFLTMRQSMKRGMMQQGPVDPDNPMAQSQKLMAYIAPLFALSGLYWAFGLVIYWVSNNLWTFGQQYFLFRNLPVVGSTTAAGAAAPATGTRTAASQSKTVAPGKAAPGKATATAGKTVSARPTTPSGTRTGQAAAKTATPGSKPAARPAQPARTAQAPKTSPAARGHAVKAQQPAQESPAEDAPATAGDGAKAARTAKAPTAAKAPGVAPKAAVATPADGTAKTGGTPKRAPAQDGESGTNGSSASANGASSTLGGGIGRLFGRSKPAPEPEDEPQKVTVRQQPVRQTRSKRSGKR